jgi:hypothetical protein
VYKETDSSVEVTLIMSFDMFVELWENLTDHIEPWWKPTPAFLIIPIDDPIP